MSAIDHKPIILRPKSEASGMKFPLVAFDNASLLIPSTSSIAPLPHPLPRANMPYDNDKPSFIPLLAW